MTQVEDSEQKNYLNNLDAEDKSEQQDPKETRPKQTNPEDTTFPSVQSTSLNTDEMKNASSKFLTKQKDRYENKTIEKGMFTSLEESVDELKVVYSSPLKSEQSDLTIKKRKPLKLNPINNSSGVELINQKELQSKSRSLEQPKKMTASTVKVSVLKVKQITNFHEFVKQSIPVNKKLVAILRRNRAGTNKLYPQFDLFMNEELKYLMNSKRKPFHLTSNYFLGTSIEPVDETNSEYVGTLKSNFSGSQFSVYDNSRGEPEILATITYASQLTCSSQPRSLQIYILSPFYSYGDLTGSDPQIKMDLKTLYDMGDNKENRKILKFVNKKPVWDVDRQIWCMDFHGKATYSSVKNMILVDAETEKKQVMILAKAGEDAFNMDVLYPMSPRIALAVASSSFDWKWASQ